MICQPRHNLTLAINKASQMLRVKFPSSPNTTPKDLKYILENQQYMRRCHQLNIREKSLKNLSIRQKKNKDSDFSNKSLKRSPSNNYVKLQMLSRSPSPKTMIKLINSSVTGLREFSSPSVRDQRCEKVSSIITSLEDLQVKNKNSKKKLATLEKKRFLQRKSSLFSGLKKRLVYN